jgi:hypothetical protein
MPGRMARRKFLQATVAGAAISVSAPYISSQAAPLTMRFAHFAESERQGIAQTQP